MTSCFSRMREGMCVTSLLCSASVLALSPAIAAEPQPAASAAAVQPVEEVLITGSLIRGAPAVGVPVTTLGTEEFKQTGALTVSDLLKSVPSVEVNPSTAVNQGGGQINRGQNVNIHGLSGTTSFRTLLLFDSTRYPIQGSNTRTIDPSIIPQLAVERVDVLATGASSMYGSDAVAGVVNVILKRRFDGAVTQARYGIASGGNRELQFSQLYGLDWGSGDATVTYEVYDRTPLRAGARDGFTVDFRPWGLDDRRPLLSSIPATISSPGNATTTIGTSCTNCFSVPKGSGWNFGAQNPGPTTTWTALLANKGTTNLVDPFAYSDITDAAQRNALTLTFDQKLFDGVEFFATGFYSNRRSQITIPIFVTPAQSSALRFVVPTSNPYYPTGAPAGLRAHYSFVREMAPYLSAQTTGGRFTGGLNLDLPFEWQGRVFGAVSDDGSRDIAFNQINENAANAALGNTVGPFPGQKVTAYTKPANIPYLNVFCDSRRRWTISGPTGFNTTPGS
jgi:iron complex outermembrane receptor protein